MFTPIDGGCRVRLCVIIAAICCCNFCAFVCAACLVSFIVFVLWHSPLFSFTLDNLGRVFLTLRDIWSLDFIVR